MHRQRLRAFKCRLNLHRLRFRSVIAECKDCHHTWPRLFPAVAFAAPISDLHVDDGVLRVTIGRGDDQRTYTLDERNVRQLARQFTHARSS